MISKQEREWAEVIQKYLFFYRDGFFELPYLSNSPQEMVNSIIKIPVTLHKSVEQVIHTNNPFCKGVMHYREIEEGLWILATNIDIKQNVIAKALYDQAEVSDYYFLTFSVFEYEFRTGNTLSDKVTLLSKCWTFYKPETVVSTYFYKGTTGKFCNLVFNKKWAEKNLSSQILDRGAELQNFLNHETGFLTWLDVVPDIDKISKEIWRILQNNNKEGSFNISNLKIEVHQMITRFFKSTLENSRIQKYKPLNNIDYSNVAKAEKIILHHLTSPFVGVESIASNVNMSPTKLKSIFKSVFGSSMLQYHKEKNIQLAVQLIQNSDLPIKSIAVATGYESASKFTAAFKKRFGILPSEVLRSN
ncbi:AraC family transcriptional regulator [Flavobacterium piscis]|uniref:AraC-like DNA-binding protein n=1 Tax=Flavobacterium piscis TaxID=1114874 RepID=A0ABU1Y1U3_9FLAO|nr:AraC family transcriptional regulator [Flavobacterium piscis]MDR7208187.1 AraC-like DNA-binding protein [Flavobacterium piscis]